MSNKWEDFYHKIYDEYRRNKDIAERSSNELVKHVMLLLATILGISIGLTGLSIKSNVNYFYLKISWVAMIIAFLVGLIYLIYSGKRYRHNKYQELRTLSDISLVQLDKNNLKITKEECDLLIVAAYHKWKPIPAIGKYVQDDFYNKNKKLINTYKEKLPSAKSLIRDKADLTGQRFHYFLADNLEVLNVSFYSITFLSLMFFTYHIITLGLVSK